MQHAGCAYPACTEGITKWPVNREVTLTDGAQSHHLGEGVIQAA